MSAASAEGQTLLRGRFVVHTPAVGEKTRVAKLALFVSLDAMNRFTMGTFAGLFLFGVGHVC
jgi:hypothetical protein